MSQDGWSPPALDDGGGGGGGGGNPPETWGDPYFDPAIGKYVQRSSRGGIRILGDPAQQSPTEVWDRVQLPNGNLYQVPRGPDGRQDWSRAVLIGAKPVDDKENPAKIYTAPDGSVWALDPITGEPVRKIFDSDVPGSNTVTVAPPGGGGGGAYGGGGYSGGGGGGGGESSTHTSISELGPIAAALREKEISQGYSDIATRLAGIDANGRMSAADRAARAAEFAAQFRLNRTQVGNDLARTLADTISTTDPAAFYGLWKYGDGNLHNALASGGTALSNAALAPGAYLLEQMNDLRNANYAPAGLEPWEPVKFSDYLGQVQPKAPTPPAGGGGSPGMQWPWGHTPGTPWGITPAEIPQWFKDKAAEFGVSMPGTAPGGQMPGTGEAPAPEGESGPSTPWGNWGSGENPYVPQQPWEAVPQFAQGTTTPPNFWTNPNPGSEGPAGISRYDRRPGPFTRPSFSGGGSMGYRDLGGPSLRDRLTQGWKRLGWDFERPFPDQATRMLTGAYRDNTPITMPPSVPTGWPSPVPPAQPAFPQAPWQPQSGRWVSDRPENLPDDAIGMPSYHWESNTTPWHPPQQQQLNQHFQGMLNNGQLGLVNPTVAMVGDSTKPNPFSGQPNPEYIFNPTNAPIGVIPARQLGYGNDNRMFNTNQGISRFAGGTMQPRATTGAISRDSGKPLTPSTTAYRGKHAIVDVDKSQFVRDLYTPGANQKVFAYDPYSGTYSKLLKDTDVVMPGQQVRIVNIEEAPIVGGKVPDGYTTLPKDWRDNGMPTITPSVKDGYGKIAKYGSDTVIFTPHKITYAGVTLQGISKVLGRNPDGSYIIEPFETTVITGIDTANSPWRTWSGGDIKDGEIYTGGLTNTLTGKNYSVSGVRDLIEGTLSHQKTYETARDKGVGQFRGIRGMDPSLDGYDPEMAKRVADASKAKVDEVLGTPPPPSQAAAPPPDYAGVRLEDVKTGTGSYRVGSGGLNTADLSEGVSAIDPKTGLPLPAGTVIEGGKDVTLVRLANGTMRFANGTTGVWSGDGSEYDPVTGTGGRVLPDGTVNKDYADVIRDIRTKAPFPMFSYMDVSLARKPQTLLSMWSRGMQSRYGIPAGDWTQFWQQYAPNAMARSATRLGY